VTRIIFFDFDGVIKESLDVKTNAFIKLFKPFGNSISERVRNHHLSNGGMSRYEKFPIYFEWANMVSNQDLVNSYSEQFSKLVFNGVVDSDWVPGVKQFIKKNFRKAILIIVSATPQNELEDILLALDLRKYFSDVFGAPASKKDSIKKSLLKYSIDSKNCIMIGDARADMDAASFNNVPFILRMHETNKDLFEKYSGEKIKNFRNL
jgi:phosphoglycolate phosphatase-like HAD superfamily hydrolase